eukprot:CCRYP_014266-RB/>CCRYP_014266-RB protein AED:0.18 eAED:0.18 QI:236/1/1/1/1/0.85/7/3669/1526
MRPIPTMPPPSHHSNGDVSRPYPLSSHPPRRLPLDPQDEDDAYNDDDDYDDYDDDGDYYPQDHGNANDYHHDNNYDDADPYDASQEQQQQHPSSPHYSKDLEQEPPHLTPRLSAPEGMEDDSPTPSRMNSLAREALGYPLGEDAYDEEQQQQQQEEEEEEEEEGSAVMGGDDAVLDLEELEQLQEEAERMKGLGNKHMAAQEYTRAYNAYSAALQLSPIGPTSHVFLSNRAASLLSLKRYSAAAVDARRAVALAPTFGKAYARLGQALYFLKDYVGAVEAYEDALRLELEEEVGGSGGGAGGGGSHNGAVTRAYLIKAKEKLALQQEKERRKAMAVTSGTVTSNGDDGVTLGEESAFQTVAYSVVTDKHGVGVASGGMANERIQEVAKEERDTPMFKIDENRVEENAPRAMPSEDEVGRRASPTMMYVETGPMGGPAQRRVDPPQDKGMASASSAVPPTDKEGGQDEPDPDFDEALRLQRRATQFLTHKKYKKAVDDFSAALFLVPDDPVLTPQLHVGRAHALNGQERFESAKNDALMALRHILRHGEEDVSAAEAYSVLGKSLYYSKDYQGAMEAFEECDRVWKLNGGKLSVFDEAYLEQCHEALDAGLGVEHADGVSLGGGASVVSAGVKSVVSTLKEGKPLTNIPKLKPPRFVSREQALQIPLNIPPMPKNWPQQSPTSPSSIATGPERTVVFLSDAMGIKLNRGHDGLIRVISVADLPPGSPILRKGKIETGDLVREAGGVDLRRPITATMWGDTVALIKMAPRPITIIVATELTSNLTDDDKSISPRVPRRQFEYGSAAYGEESVTGLISSVAARGQGSFHNWEEVMREMGIVPPSSALGEEAVEGSIENTHDSEKQFEVLDEIAEDDAVDDGAALSAEPKDETSECCISDHRTNTAATVNNDDAQAANDITENGDDQETQDNPPEHPTDAGDALEPSLCITENTIKSEYEQEIIDIDAVSNVATNTDAEAVIENESLTVGDGDCGQNSVEAIQPQETQQNVGKIDEMSAMYESQRAEDTECPKPPSLNRDILFDDRLFYIHALDDGSDEAKTRVQGWTNKRWIAMQPCLVFSGLVTRVSQEKKIFWSSETYQTRTLAIFKVPNVNPSLPTVDVSPPSSEGAHIILILRDPTDSDEVRRLLPINDASNPLTQEDMASLLNSFLVAENVIDPMTCKLRLSQLTTPTSVPLNNDDASSSKKLDRRKRSFFELLTPTCSMLLSAVLYPEKGKCDEATYCGVDSIVETAKFEDAISNALYAAHSLTEGLEDVHRVWTHQVVLGTLHSYVISGNDKLLQTALSNALHSSKSDDLDALEATKLESSTIDARDLNWKTPLIYACERKRPSTVSLLINAGANGMIPTLDAQTPLHLCAERLDDKSLSIILSATHPTRPDPNAVDSLGRTPMYLASAQGNDSSALARCLSALNAWGGQFLPVRDTAESKKLLHPIHSTSFQWKYEQLAILLSYVCYRFPLENSELGGVSLGSKYGCPIHAAVISLRERMFSALKNLDIKYFSSSEPAIVK